VAHGTPSVLRVHARASLEFEPTQVPLLVQAYAVTVRDWRPAVTQVSLALQAPQLP
jgi:hypothetical protein